MIELNRAQAYMEAQAIDGWLLYDFRGSNPVFWHVLGARQPTSRRNFLFVPAAGEAVLLAHGLDKLLFTDFDVYTEWYTTWGEMQEWLKGILSGCGRVAMEYSPGGTIPMHSWVDAGTVEYIRAQGAEVVSSANLFQVAAASWSERSISAHERACTEVAAIKDEAFALIGERLRVGEPVNEYEVQQFIRQRFAEQGLITDHGPIVAVNAHSGDPHYEPSEAEYAPIQEGDWILIDLWAKYEEPEDVYCDITWVGYAGSDVPSEYQEVFDVVTGARDAVVERLEEAWEAGETLQGWQLDDAARDYIEDAGYGEFFTHRTGHSMGPSPTPHALGANLDNLETHDTREIIPGIGFSVEPGVYLPEFGIRSEIDMYIDPEKGPLVTTAIQREIIRIH